MTDEAQDSNNAQGNERTFLHDLSNPLAISYGNIRLIAGKLEKDLHSMEPGAILEKLNKAIRAFERANALLDMRRNFLKTKDS